MVFTFVNLEPAHLAAEELHHGITLVADAGLQPLALASALVPP